MANPSMFRYFNILYLLFFTLVTLTWNPYFSSSLQILHHNPNFDSDVALFGDAVSVAGCSSVQLTRPSPSSFGLLMRSQPFKFIESNPTSPTSFSTDFSFSISPQNGDGLALVIVPTDFPSKFHPQNTFGLPQVNRFLGIEFDTSMETNVGDENANHVGIDVGSFASARVSNVSSINLVLNSGLKLQSWIDYDASSKRLEVRLTKLGAAKPYNPLLAYQIDLSEMWKDQEVLVGLSSSSGNSSQTCSVHSWKFRVRSVPTGMHSQPVNPQRFSNQHGDHETAHKKRSCPWGVLSGILYAAGCGAFVVFILLLLVMIFVNAHKMIPMECSLRSSAFRYEKVNVVVEKNNSVNVTR